MEHLITKYLQGNLTLDEQHELSKWIQSDEKNAEILKKIHAYWHYHKDNLDNEELEVRLRVLSRIREQRTKRDMSSRRDTRKILPRAAASIIVVCSLIFGLYQYHSNLDSQTYSSEVTLVEKISLPGQKITTVLPDGTQVKLNADSKIIVPSRFDGNTREITLIGEAFFNVKRDELHPFIIKTDKVEVKVLGTSFNVRAYQDDISPAIAVKTGEVAVKSRKTNKEVRLTPNEIAHLDNQDLIKTTISSSSNPFAWINQQLVFNNESFSEVLKKVSRWYGIEVDLDTDITLDKRYTATYNNPTMVEMMDVLAFVYGFKYTYNEKEREIIIQ